MKEYHVGQVVLSKQGRDKGSFYLIAAIDKDFCFLVDGKKKTFARPKKKSFKHLQGTKKDAGLPGEQLRSGAIPQDSDVRGLIRRISLETSAEEV